MTKETILTKLVEIGVGTPAFDFSKYEDLVNLLKQEVRDENNKAAGKNHCAKLAKAIIKSGTKNYPIRDQKLNIMAHGKTIDGVQYFLDGYRIAAFYERMDFPEWEHDNWYNIHSYINNMDFADAESEMPSIGEIKSALAVAKGQKKKCIFGFDGVTVNAQYLLDFLEGFPDAKVHISSERPHLSPIYIESEEGFGILLPIKPTEGYKPGFNYVY